MEIRKIIDRAKRPLVPALAGVALFGAVFGASELENKNIAGTRQANFACAEEYAQKAINHDVMVSPECQERAAKFSEYLEPSPSNESIASTLRSNSPEFIDTTEVIMLGGGVGMIAGIALATYAARRPEFRTESLSSS
jgi:hypothetical protein